MHSDMDSVSSRVACGRQKA